MKKRYKSFVAVVFAVFSLCGCTKSNKAIIRMQKMEEGVSSPTTEAELKEAIAKYQQRVADNQIADSQVGIWYKMLAVRYLDAKQYGQALQNFQKAIHIFSNPSSYLLLNMFPNPQQIPFCSIIFAYLDSSPVWTITYAFSALL